MTTNEIQFVVALDTTALQCEYIVALMSDVRGESLVRGHGRFTMPVTCAGYYIRDTLYVVKSD